MIYIYLVSAGLLLVAALLALVRAERGPSMLDRTIALDIFATVLVAGVALEAAWSRRIDTLPILVALSMIGFVSSVTVARFAAIEPPEQRRIRTLTEVAEEEARLRAAEEAADEAVRIAHERYVARTTGPTAMAPKTAGIPRTKPGPGDRTPAEDESGDLR